MSVNNSTFAETSDNLVRNKNQNKNTLLNYSEQFQNLAQNNNNRNNIEYNNLMLEMANYSPSNILSSYSKKTLDPPFVSTNNHLNNNNMMPQQINQNQGSTIYHNNQPQNSNNNTRNAVNQYTPANTYTASQNENSDTSFNYKDELKLNVNNIHPNTIHPTSPKNNDETIPEYHFYKGDETPTYSSDGKLIQPRSPTYDPNYHQAILSISSNIQVDHNANVSSFPYAFTRQSRTFPNYKPFETLPSMNYSANLNQNFSVPMEAIGLNFQDRATNAEQDWLDNFDDDDANQIIKQTPQNQSLGGEPARKAYVSNSGSDNDSIDLTLETAATSKYTDKNDKKTSQLLLLTAAKDRAKFPYSQLAKPIKNLGEQLKSNAQINTKNQKIVKNIEYKLKKEHQLFALVTLIRSFKISRDSLCQRNLVYLNYSNICKKHNIKPICNAAFGKIVKVFHPGIKTRRLGVRGSSKYNYCGMRLIDESNASLSELNDQELSASNTDTEINSNVKSLSDSSLKTSSSPSNETNPTSMESPSDLKIPRNKTFLKPEIFDKLVFDQQMFYDIEHQTEFVPNFDRIFAKIDNVKHKEFLKIYCDVLTSLVDCWRYIRFESLFKKMATFNSLDFLPKDLADVFERDKEVLLELTHQCDLEAFRISIQLITKVTFQYVPDFVQSAFETFENEYLNFIHQQKNIIFSDKKNNVNLRFLYIIRSLGRVLFLSSNFVKLLYLDEDKKYNPESQNYTTINSFKKEFAALDFRRIICNCPLIPLNVKDQLIKLILSNVEGIVKALENQKQSNCAYRDSLVNGISKIFLYISDQFTDIDPRDLLLYIGAFSQAVLREITIEHSTQHFSLWWSITCWCDEYLLLLGEIGSFLHDIPNSHLA